MAGLLLFAAGRAEAVTKFDQILGIRIAQAISQKILGSAPLPSLEEKQRAHFSPQVARVFADVDNPTSRVVVADPEEGATGIPAYAGSLKGWTVGAGYTQSSMKKLSYYGFATASWVNGEVFRKDVDFPLGLKNMENSGYNLSLGMSYRLWSEKQFPLVLGILGGPFVSKFDSRFQLNIEQESTYSSTSFVYGPMFGVQALLKIFGAALNPYFLQYYDLSDPCQQYETNMPGDMPDKASSAGCSRDNREIRMEGSFYAYGLNVSLFGLSFGAFSTVQKNEELETVKVKNYTLGYTFNF